MADSITSLLLVAALAAPPGAPVTPARAAGPTSTATPAATTPPVDEPASAPPAATTPTPSSGPSSDANPATAGSAPADPPAEPAPRDPTTPTAVPTSNLSPGTSATPEGPEPGPAAPIEPGRFACHGSIPCQRLVALGAVTGALGLAGVASGVALVLRPDQVDPEDPTTAITYRPAGTAILTIGLGVLATSLLMLLTANRASRRALNKHTRPHTTRSRPIGGI